MQISLLWKLISFFSFKLLIVLNFPDTASAQLQGIEVPPVPIQPEGPSIAPERLSEDPAPELEIPPTLSGPGKRPPEIPEVGNEEANPVSADACPALVDSDETRFTANTITILGSSVLQTEITQQVGCYEGHDITLSDLFNLRSQITQLYIDNGYITSGAFIPNNQVFSDTIQIQIIEGDIKDIKVNGLHRLREGYVRDRLRRASRPPLNRDHLQDALQLIQLDPNIDQVNAALTTGSEPGRSLLILNLKETESFDFLTDVNNHRSPSIGSEGFNVSGSYRNLIGIGEVLSASYSITEGLDLYDVGVSFPFNATDGTFHLRYNNSGSRIVEEAFEEVGIRSETETVSVGIRQPIVRTPSEELSLSLDFDWRSSQSFILKDIPFSFSVGPEDGRSQVSVIRFSQEWTKRSTNQVLAARSQFNIGLDVLGATNNDTGTDGQFSSWQGQFQWVKQVSPDLLSLIKFNAQLTPDSLLPLERFSLGGLGTVRGYAQNQIVSDNALNASAELRIPLTKNPTTLQLTPFIDAGYGWNNRTPTPSNNFLLGTGIGLRWQATPELFLRTDHGFAIVDVEDSGNSLQENGFYFSITYRPQ